MGPSRQFIPGLPDYNADMKNHGFYNFQTAKKRARETHLRGVIGSCTATPMQTLKTVTMLPFPLMTLACRAC
jgi:hypothetical protein